MFEIVATIAEIIIALAGIMISVIEVYKVRREKETDKAIVQVELELVESVRNTTLGQELKNVYDSIKKIIDNNDKEKWGEVENSLPKIVESYRGLADGLQPIYKQLLKDESRFSLSYGFGRYIDALREFVLTVDKLDECERKINDFLEVEQACKCGENGKYFINEMRVLAQYAGRYPELSLSELENYFESEKKKRYPDYSKDKEAPVYAMYRLFYNMRCSVDELYKHYKDLCPYIDELKLKYSYDRGTE